MGPSNSGARTGVRERAVSLAHRMLSGAGEAQVVAYRVPGQPVLDSVAHGLTRSGELVLAVTVDPQEMDPAVLVTGEPVEVRMDVTKVAPEPDVRIVAASAHLLARLEWLDPLDAELLVGTGEIPELVAAVAGAPNGRLAVLEAERVVLHDGSGVTPVEHRELVVHHGTVGAAPGDACREVESTGLDAAMDVDRVDLAGLCDAAENGWIPAHLLTQKPSTGGCAHTVERDFIVDVDLTGITVLRHGARVTSVYFVPFERGRTSPEGLTASVSTLLGAGVAA
ncbi:hypothetical protein IUU84_03920 [Kocuria rhizophila]|nr:hypothetical protein [Kocuria rhizophila]